jgi:hypothetical protein
MTVEIPPTVFTDAIREYWSIRERQTSNQQAKGIIDTGNRSSVTGGAQMDGFVHTIAEMLVKVGVKPEEISYRVNVTTLPGFFRPTKKWDMVVVRKKELLAALELKSQVGPSFGNNFNNRTEEAMGSALDIWRAYREGAFGAAEQPWLGYLFVLEDCPQSQSPVRVEEPHFKVFEEFRGASYARRYELFCRRLVLERQYSGACLLLSARDTHDNYTEPATDLSAQTFLTGLLRRVSQP